MTTVRTVDYGLGSTADRPTMLDDALLVCGIGSSLLYMAMTVGIATLWPSYSSRSQTISELSAIGAPTRPIWVALGVVYTLLVTAFGFGIWRAARGTRSLRIAGVLVIAYGALGVFWPFAPMHLREVLAAGGGSMSDTLHIALAMVTVALMLLAIGFAAAALGSRFRIYSITTMLVLFVFGVLTTRDAPAVGANRPTPWLGVWERINLGSFLLWVIVIAVVLEQRRRSRR